MKTCPSCHGQRVQQKTCNQCRGIGCGSCNNGYITVTCAHCNGNGTIPD